MNAKGTVRLKLLLFVLVTALLASPFPEVRDDRQESEAVEKEWVDVDPGTIEAATATSSKDNNGEEKDEGSIQCAHFDETRCETNGECDIKMKKCEPENHLKVVGCLAIFTRSNKSLTNSTEEFLPVARKMFKSLGCMQYQHADSMDCVHHEICRQGRVFRSGIGMCCCTKDNCNNVGTIEMLNPDFKKDGEDNLSLDEELAVSEDSYTSKGTIWMYISIGCVIVISICATLIICFVWRFQKKKKKKTSCQVIRKTENDPESGPLVALEEMEKKTAVVIGGPLPKSIPISNLQMVKEGRFGKVYRGTWDEGERKGSYVAIKIFDEFSETIFNHEKRIYDELAKLPKWYPNVLRMLTHGKCPDNKDFWMVLDYHEHLSLFDVLVFTPISITTANRFILTMLDGLQFLHDDRPYFFGHPKPPILHRDIKSKNILVKSDLTTCIADFGLARTFDFDIERSDLLGQVGTRRYMSPEMLEGATEFTANAFKAMDVYSMGLVIWEVISRVQLSPSDVVPPYMVPYEEVGPNPNIGLMRGAVARTRPEFRPEVLAHDHMGSMARVTEEMWETEAFARITAGCAFARVWDLVMNAADNSEGYHSGGSTKDKYGTDPIDHTMTRKPEDIEEMVRWHLNPTGLPHPSPDPFRDNCPPPPPLPVPLEKEISYKPLVPNWSPSASVYNDKKEFENENRGREERSKELVFDMGMRRYVSNQDLLEEEDVHAKPSDTRCSTPTPEFSKTER